jgi:hypothetical protein
LVNHRYGNRKTLETGRKKASGTLTLETGRKEGSGTLTLETGRQEGSGLHQQGKKRGKYNKKSIKGQSVLTFTKQ